MDKIKHRDKSMEVMQVTDNEFKLIKRYIYQEAGIFLRDTKKPLVSNRLRKRLLFHGFNSYKKYYDYITKHNEGKKEAVHFINALTTNESYFYRNSEHFDYLISTLFPELLKGKENTKRPRITLWSAACASGEEPYTLAIMLREKLQGFRDLDIQIIASDINREVLQRAQLGIYKPYAVNRMEEKVLKKYFTYNIEEDRYYIDQKIKRMVKFYHHNLLKIFFKYQFDVIVCRNVMIYFDEESKNRVLKNLYENLRLGGYLIVGYSESLMKQYLPLKYIKPTVYQKIG